MRARRLTPWWHWLDVRSHPTERLAELRVTCRVRWWHPWLAVACAGFLVRWWWSGGLK